MIQRTYAFPSMLRPVWSFAIPCLVCFSFILSYFSANLSFYGTQARIAIGPMWQASLHLSPVFLLGILVLRSSGKSALLCVGLVLLAFVPPYILPLFPTTPVSVFGKDWDRLLFISPICLFLFGAFAYRITSMEHERVESWMRPILKVAICFFISSCAILAKNMAYESTVVPAEDPRAVSIGLTPAPDTYPNILYLVPDGYARQDVLAQWYGYDNEPFLRELEARGFLVNRNAFANYTQTKYSQATTLNLRYISDLLPNASSASSTLYNLIKSSYVFRRLQDLGYTLATYPTGYIATAGIKGAEILYGDRWGLLAKAHGISSDLEHDLTNRSLALVPFKWRSAICNPNAAKKMGNPFRMHRLRIDACLDGMGKDGLSLSEPFLIYGHVICPHPPFQIDAKGGVRKVHYAYSLVDGTHWAATIGGKNLERKYREGYIRQLQWINGRILDLIDRAQANYSKRPLVIILQSDHGPGSAYDQESSGNTNLRERLGILLAVQASEEVQADLRGIRSPVNLFRVLLKGYFGEDHPLLPEQAFHVSWKPPVRFYEVAHSELTQLLPFGGVDPESKPAILTLP